MRNRAILFGALMALLLPASSRGQQTAPAASTEPVENAELAKKLSNPISDLVSVPFQFNWEQGVGPDKQTQFYQFGFGVFAAHPEAGPTWKIRSAIVLLLPRRR